MALLSHQTADVSSADVIVLVESKALLVETVVMMTAAHMTKKKLRGLGVEPSSHRIRVQKTNHCASVPAQTH